MSRNYLQHPELFPEMKTSDPYYEDHVRDSKIDKMNPQERKEFFRGRNYQMREYQIKHATNYGMNSVELAERILKEVQKPKCAICNKCDHTTEWHHKQLIEDLGREK